MLPRILFGLRAFFSLLSSISTERPTSLHVSFVPSMASRLASPAWCLMLLLTFYYWNPNCSLKYSIVNLSSIYTSRGGIQRSYVGYLAPDQIRSGILRINVHGVYMMYRSSKQPIKLSCALIEIEDCCFYKEGLHVRSDAATSHVSRCCFTRVPGSSVRRRL